MAYYMSIYTEPDASEPCSRCRFRNYDSSLDEMWCGHDPAPAGLPERLLVGPWGHCDYWEEDQ